MGKPILWPAERVEQNESARFVSDTQIEKWNNIKTNITVTDWNEAINSGFYNAISGAKNAPDNVALSGTVITSGNLIIQQLYPEDNNNEELIYYIRKGFKSNYNITWSKWFITNLYMEELYSLTPIIKGGLPVSNDVYGYNNKFNKLIPNTVTSIYFTDIKMPSNATLIDVDDDGDNGVVAWLDTNDNTKMYVSTQHKGVKVEGNSNVNGMFYNKKLKLIDFTNFDTSTINCFSMMFNYCSGLTSLDVSNFDISNATNISQMFVGCSGLTSLDVSNFDTKNVTNMNAVFSGTSLTSIDVSNFDTKNVTNMSYIFSEIEEDATIIGLDKFDTSNVTNMEGMFRNFSGTKPLDLSNFDTSNVTSMCEMFSRCSAKSINVSKFNTSKVTDMGDMFKGCFYNAGDEICLDLSNFDTSNVIGMNNMFDGFGCYTINLQNFDTSNVITMNSMFYDSDIKSIDLSNFKTDKLVNTAYMFECCKNLESINLANFTTPKLTYMNRMFASCRSLVSVDLSNFDTSNVTDTDNMRDMFYNCSKLTSIKVGDKFKWISTLSSLGLSGTWQDETGTQYTSSSTFPSNVAHTYTKVS